MTNDLQPQDSLFQEIQQLINTAKQRAAATINAEITQLYWEIGQRLHTETLQGQRAEYGKQILKTLSQQLTQTYGKGWSDKQLRHCLHFAKTFPDIQIVSALRRQLTWTHLKTLMYIEDPLKRDFYIEICRLEGWSSRQLQERLNSMLYERTALSRKPEATIRHDLDQLHQTHENPSIGVLLCRDKERRSRRIRPQPCPQPHRRRRIRSQTHPQRNPPPQTQRILRTPQHGMTRMTTHPGSAAIPGENIPPTIRKCCEKV